MSDEVNKQIIQLKEQYLAVLMKRLTAAYAQKGKTLNDTAQVGLDEEVRQLEQEIGALNQEIAKLKTPPDDVSRPVRQATIQWDEQIHAINYSRAQKVISPVFDGLKNQKGSALFLMRKSRSMGGQWCAQKVKYRIGQELGSALKSVPIAFAHRQTVSPSTFLLRLASQFKVDVSMGVSDERLLTQKLIERIFDSLVNGNILLLEIDICTLNASEDFLAWFVNDFWGPLTLKVRTASKKRMVSLIALLSIQGSIPKRCLPSEICCNKTNFNGQKILELPLQNWTEQEIYIWLVRFSGLTAQLEDDDIARMATSIYAQTQGRPRDIYHELMEETKAFAS